MNLFWQDVMYAFRRLRKTPGFAITAVLTLALGIGATTAIFTLVYQVLLRPLPVVHPEQLYKVGRSVDCCVNSGLADDWTMFSADFYHSLRDNTPGTEGMIAMQAGATTVSVRRAGQGDSTEPMLVRFVSGNYFDVLQPGLLHGRALEPTDDVEGAPATAVISYQLWQTKFAADPGIVGSTLLLTGHPVTVIGVTKPAFYGDRNDTNPAGIWMTLVQEPALEPTRKLNLVPADHWLDILVRLDSPSKVVQTQLALQAELKQWIGAHADLFADGWSAENFKKQTTELAAASGGINDLGANYADNLHSLQLVAVFVLLIACANLANLLLVRGMARRQEIAVRNALGAPRGRVVREMLVEAVLLSLIGGACGVLLSYLCSRAIIAMAMPGVTVNPISPTPSPMILLFAFAVSLLTGLLFGTVPAWLASRSNPVEALRGANRSTRETGALPQKILVSLQAALSLALLSTAGLLLTNLNHLKHQDFHFKTDGRLLLYTDLEAGGYSYAQLAGLYQRFDDELAHLPGIDGIAYGTYTPQVGNNWGTGVWLAGQTQGGAPGSSYGAANPDYFRTLGIRLKQGRLLAETDTATSPHVAVVNETFAKRYFPGKPAVGQRFGNSPRMNSEFEIVGVIEDTRYNSPSLKLQPMFLTPIAQATVFTGTRDIGNEQSKHFAGNIVVLYRGSEKDAAAEVKETLRKINPQIPIIKMLGYNEQMSRNFSQSELVVRLTSLFGALALILASIGLYGVTAYTVARRTGEIGIRMALGATRSNVLAMIVRGAVWQVGLGLLIGIPVTYACGKFVEHTLYETSAFQPLVLVSVTAILLLFALAAALIPARRAASIEPMNALRTE